jgi:hypothetical protein
MKPAAMWTTLSAVRLRVRNAPGTAGALVILTAGALAFVAYAAAAWFAAPWLAQHVLERIARSAGGGAVQFAAARFNPLTLSLAIANPSIDVTDASASYTAEVLGIDFAALTLLGRPAVDSLAIAAPRLEITAHALRAAAGSSAWQRILAGAAIEQLAVERGRLVVRESDRTPPRQWVLDAVTMRAESLDLRAGAGNFAIAVGELLGSTVEVEGVASTGAVQGQVAVRNMDLQRLVQHLELRTDAAAGVLDLAAQFSVRAPNGLPTLQLTNGQVAARGVTLAPVVGVSIDAPILGAAVDASLSLVDGIAATGTLAVTGSALTLRDARAEPEARFHFTDGRASWTNTAGAQSQFDTEASATLAEGGTASYALKRASQPARDHRVLVRLVDVPATVLGAYGVRPLNAEITGGRIDAQVELASIGATLRGRAQLTARELVLAAGALPAIEMGLAVLENPAAVIALDVPIVIEDATRSPPAAIAATLVDQVAALGAAPYEALGSLVNRNADSLRMVEFMPGEAALPALGVDTLTGLGAALAMRPKVGVEITPVYDPQLDRRALATQQVELHVSLATAVPTVGARPEPVDFASPRAQDVLDEFAGERLPDEEVATIASLFDRRPNAAADSAARTGYYRALFDALAAKEQIADSAVRRLGRFRAQAIADVLAAHEVAPQRIMVANAAAQRTPEAATVIVPLALTSLFDEARPVPDGGGND